MLRKPELIEVVGYKTNSIVRFKRPRSKSVNELGCKYSVASRENLSFGSWTNSGAYNFGDIYTASNFPNTEIGISTVTADENTKFIKLKVTSPQNDRVHFISIRFLKLIMVTGILATKICWC